MNYRIRPGVVLEEVCGEYLLLATMEAGQHCPYVYQINETAAFFWKLLERGLDEDQMAAETASEYDAPEEALRSDLRQFLGILMEKGYLLPKGEGI